MAKKIAKKPIEKKPTVKKPAEKKYANDIWAFMKEAFSNQEAFNKMTPAYKSKFAFMLNRFCSIKYPLPAALISHIGINSAEIVNYWQSEMVKKGEKGVPYWIFSTLKNTKAKKTEVTTKKNKVYYPSTETVQKYCSLYKIDDKTFTETMLLYEHDLLCELMEFDELLKK